MKKTIIIAAVAALLTACGSDSTTSGTPAGTTTTIKVINMNGGTTDITGTWVSQCFTDSPPDYKYIEEFSGGSIYKLTDMGYTTTDGSCGGTSSANGIISGTFTIGGSVTATGWIDNAGTIAAPTAQDGATTLPATPSATVLTTTVTSASEVFVIPTNNPGSIRRAVDASVPSNIALFDIYDDGVNGLVANITFKATKQ